MKKNGIIIAFIIFCVFVILLLVHKYFSLDTRYMNNNDFDTLLKEALEKCKWKDNVKVLHIENMNNEDNEHLVILTNGEGYISVGSMIFNNDKWYWDCYDTMISFDSGNFEYSSGGFEFKPFKTKYWIYCGEINNEDIHKIISSRDNKEVYIKHDKDIRLWFTILKDIEYPTTIKAYDINGNEIEM